MTMPTIKRCLRLSLNRVIMLEQQPDPGAIFPNLDVGASFFENSREVVAISKRVFGYWSLLAKCSVASVADRVGWT